MARRWYHPVSIGRSLMLRQRVYFGALAGIAVLLAAPAALPGTIKASLAWDAGGAVYLLFAFNLMRTCDMQNMKRLAARRDDSRVVILVLILLSIGASFVAIAQLIGHAKAPDIDTTEKALLAALAAVTIIISWGVTQVAFALHYAHDYYRPDEGSDALNGLIFPRCEVPDYWDFLYFAISLGAAAQTSDVSIASRSLRRLASLHAVIGFFFNTAILALTVNIAASLV